MCCQLSYGAQEMSPKGFGLSNWSEVLPFFFFFKVTKNVRSTNIREKTKNLELVSLSWTLI